MNSFYFHRFHFPHGKPLPQIAVDTTLQRIQALFNTFPNLHLPKESFIHLLTACGVPTYWRSPLYHCTQQTPEGSIDGHLFIEFWRQ